MKQQTLYVVLVVIVVIGILGYIAYTYAIDSPFRISSAAGKQMLKGRKVDLVLDVRTDLERNTLGYYPGSVHIPSADLDQRMPSAYPDKEIRILAYCNTGHRARMATEKLRALGYMNSYYISSTYTTLQ
jgi:rhodanese-related sulfurtransferase